MKTDGNLIRAKVSKITPQDIEYKLSNNLEGPLYVLPTADIQKIDFENGAVQSFMEDREEAELSLEELKNLILLNINENAYSHSGQDRYHAEFEGNQLKLWLKNKTNGELRSPALYELDGDCVFHKLSVRNSGITFINIVTNRVYGSSSRKIDTTRRFSKPIRDERTKLVIQVRNQVKAEIIRDALMQYNRFFQDTRIDFNN